MELVKILQEKSDIAWEIYIPNLSIDSVVFGFDKSSLKVLLVKMKDKDLWALSNMVQFVFRSRLRKGEPINLYVPSSRMRELFLKWLNGDYDE